MTSEPMSDSPTVERQLSKMQRVRKRELRRAMGLLHDKLKTSIGTENGTIVYGLRAAISVLGDMRKAINEENPDER